MKKYALLLLIAISFAIGSLGSTLNEDKMGFEFGKKKTIIEILDGNKNDVSENIDLLAQDYFEKTGKKLNKGCTSCIIEMLLTLKNQYKMTQFKFKRRAATYKNKKGDKTTISNSTMTDEKAVEFLKTNPKRIELFSEYPSNWKDLVKKGVSSESDAEKEVRLAAEAEAKAVAEANKGGNGVNSETDTEKKSDKLSHDELMKITLKDLRIKYPEIKATSTKDFVNQVLK